MDGINHLGNCLSFTVDPTLNYAAISLPKGEILIINALPSLLDFNKKKLKTVYLYIPEKGDSVMEITNIKFGQIYSGKGEKKYYMFQLRNIWHIMNGILMKKVVMI